MQVINRLANVDERKRGRLGAGGLLRPRPAELTSEPRFRGAPVTLRRRWRDLEDMRGFLDGESTKRAQLHDSGELRVDALQAIKRMIEREDRDLIRRGHFFRIVN